MASLDALSSHDVVQVAEHMSWEAMQKVTLMRSVARPGIPSHAFSHSAHVSERFFTITFDSVTRPKHTKAAKKQKQMSLHVFLNSALMGPNYREMTQARNGQLMVEGHTPKNCFYHGTVVGEARSRVAISLCDQMAGVIQAFNETYMIQPKQLSHNEETLAPHHGGWHSQSLHTAQPHVMYTSADLKRKDVFKCGGAMAPDDLIEQAHGHGKSHHFTTGRSHDYSHIHDPQTDGKSRHSSPQRERLQASAPVTVEVYNVNDKAYYDVWGGASEYHALFLWNIAASYYSISTNLDPPVLVRIVGQTTFATANPTEMTTAYRTGNTASVSSLLSSFRTYAREVAVSRDQTTLLSGADFSSGISGYAYVSVGCTNSSVGINEAMSPDHPAFVAAIIAHELGHNLGMCHDPPADRSFGVCASLPASLQFTDVCDNHIMQASTNPDFVFDTFSQCSQLDYSSQIEDGSLHCLDTQTNAENWTSTSGTCGNGVLEPGEECDCGNTDDCSNAPAPLTNACCEGATGSSATACKLKAGRSCSPHQACCTANCTAQASSVVCRAQGFGTAPQEACDLAETCDGTTFDCPKDLFRGNGSSCTPGAPNTTLLQSTVPAGVGGVEFVSIRFQKLFQPQLVSARITQYNLRWELVNDSSVNGALSVVTDALEICLECHAPGFIPTVEVYEISMNVSVFGEYRIWVTATNSIGEGGFDHQYSVSVSGPAGETSQEETNPQEIISDYGIIAAAVTGGLVLVIGLLIGWRMKRSGVPRSSSYTDSSKEMTTRVAPTAPPSLATVSTPTQPSAPNAPSAPSSSPGPENDFV